MSRHGRCSKCGGRCNDTCTETESVTSDISCGNYLITYQITPVTVVSGTPLIIPFPNVQSQKGLQFNGGIVTIPRCADGVYLITLSVSSTATSGTSLDVSIQVTGAFNSPLIPVVIGGVHISDTIPSASTSVTVVLYKHQTLYISASGTGTIPGTFPPTYLTVTKISDI